MEAGDDSRFSIRIAPGQIHDTGRAALRRMPVCRPAFGPQILASEDVPDVIGAEPGTGKRMRREPAVKYEQCS